MIITLTEGGSTKSLNTVLAANGCLRRDALYQEMRAAGAVFYPGKRAAIGTKLHAYLEHYHGHHAPADAILAAPFGPEGHSSLIEHNDETTAEAKRVFEWYCGNFPASRFGASQAEVELSMDFAGVEGLSGRLDLVSTYPGDDQIPPGVYLADHKTLERRPSEENYYLRALKTIWYMHLYQKVVGPIDGFIFHFLVTTKVPQSYLRWRPPPDKDELDALTNTIVTLKERFAREGSFANASACYDGFSRRECPFLTDGSCLRH